MGFWTLDRPQPARGWLDFGDRNKSLRAFVERVFAKKFTIKRKQTFCGCTSRHVTLDIEICMYVLLFFFDAEAFLWKPFRCSDMYFYFVYLGCFAILGMFQFHLFICCTVFKTIWNNNLVFHNSFGICIVPHQMWAQCAWLRWCIFTMVAFIGFFSSVGS